MKEEKESLRATTEQEEAGEVQPPPPDHIFGMVVKRWRISGSYDEF